MSWLSAGLRVFQERSARVLTFASHTEFHIPLCEKVDVKRVVLEIKDEILIVKSPATQTIKNVIPIAEELKQFRSVPKAFT